VAADPGKPIAIGFEIARQKSNANVC
jgi:hypothetical protein